MISTSEYFGKPRTAAQLEEAERLLEKVNALGNEAAESDDTAFEWAEDPDTHCCISGARGGDGDGGFRTPSSTTGATNSSHKEAKAVDVYDPNDYLDKWLDRFEDGTGGNSKLAECGLYREHPDVTRSWCHLTTRAPATGRRTFHP